VEDRVMKLFATWAQWSVFPPAFLIGLQAMFHFGPKKEADMRAYVATCCGTSSSDGGGAAAGGAAGGAAGAGGGGDKNEMNVDAIDEDDIDGVAIVAPTPSTPAPALAQPSCGGDSAIVQLIQQDPQFIALSTESTLSSSFSTELEALRKRAKTHGIYLPELENSNSADGSRSESGSMSRSDRSMVHELKYLIKYVEKYSGDYYGQSASASISTLITPTPMPTSMSAAGAGAGAGVGAVDGSAGYLGKYNSWEEGDHRERHHAAAVQMTALERMLLQEQEQEQEQEQKKHSRSGGGDSKGGESGRMDGAAAGTGTGTGGYADNNGENLDDFDDIDGVPLATAMMGEYSILIAPPPPLPDYSSYSKR
jgi:hypothetical protein